jgi:hypothetical protein
MRCSAIHECARSLVRTHVKCAQVEALIGALEAAALESPAPAPSACHSGGEDRGGGAATAPQHLHSEPDVTLERGASMAAGSKEAMAMAGSDSGPAPPALDPWPAGRVAQKGPDRGGGSAPLPPALRALVSSSGAAMLRELCKSVTSAQAEVSRVQDMLLLVGSSRAVDAAAAARPLAGAAPAGASSGSISDTHAGAASLPPPIPPLAHLPGLGAAGGEAAATLDGVRDGVRMLTALQPPPAPAQQQRYRYPRRPGYCQQALATQQRRRQSMSSSTPSAAASRATSASGAASGRGNQGVSGASSSAAGRCVERKAVAHGCQTEQNQLHASRKKDEEQRLGARVGATRWGHMPQPPGSQARLEGENGGEGADGDPVLATEPSLAATLASSRTRLRTSASGADGGAPAAAAATADPAAATGPASSSSRAPLTVPAAPGSAGGGEGGGGAGVVELEADRGNSSGMAASSEATWSLSSWRAEMAAQVRCLIKLSSDRSIRWT